MTFDFEKILTDVEYLLRNYSQEKRNAIQPFHAEVYFKYHPTEHYSPEFELVRESLLEHVGMLPVLAMYFHPYCEEHVDIGKVLQILAIHDIGELEIGDESAFTKNYDDNQAEIDAALKILHPSQHGIYMEFEELETIEAKYAKTIDKLVGDFYDIFSDPDDTEKRYAHFVGVSLEEIVQLKIDKKTKYMEWSSFFKEFYPLLVERLDQHLNSYLNGFPLFNLVSMCYHDGLLLTN